MGQLTRGQTLAIVALLAVVTGWVGVTALRTDRPSPASGIVVREAPPLSGSSPASVSPAGASGASPATSGAPEAEIVVHVAGAVKRPGLYHLRPGARNDDAVKAAGGFTAAANPDALNLAAHCEDGIQLYIPTHAEHPGGASSSDMGSPVSSSPSAPASTASHSGSKKSGGQSSHAAGKLTDKLTDPSQGSIDLNTADAAQLQRIPGIGPAMAERILAYRRTVGRFQSTDEMLRISGIGDKKFQKMKPYLSVH